MIYLDASYLAKLYVDEPGAEEVVEWAEGKGRFISSMHGRLELVSVFKRHQREGVLSASRVRELLLNVEGDEASGLLRWLPVTDDLITHACAKLAAMPPAIFLRAADALHLTCAADAGLKEIYSHDRRLLAAAPHFKLKGVDVIADV